MSILVTILDCLKILFQAFRYGIVNMPFDNSGSAAMKAIGLLNPFFIIILAPVFASIWFFMREYGASIYVHPKGAPHLISPEKLISSASMIYGNDICKLTRLNYRNQIVSKFPKLIELYEKLLVLRTHGMTKNKNLLDEDHGGWYYEMHELGHNFRMTDLQGAIGLVQMKRLPALIKDRQLGASIYNEALKEIEWIELPKTPEDFLHSWQSYVLYIDPSKAPMPRNNIMEQLHARGISSRPGTHAVHMLGFYRDSLGCKPDDFPNSRDCHENSLAIPIHSQMSQSDYEYVIDALVSITV